MGQILAREVCVREFCRRQLDATQVVRMVAGRGSELGEGKVRRAEVSTAYLGAGKVRVGQICGNEISHS